MTEAGFLGALIPPEYGGMGPSLAARTWRSRERASERAHVRVEAAELMRFKAAARFDAGEPCGAEANMALLPRSF